MWFKNKLAKLVNIFSSVFHGGDLLNIESCDVLLVRHDADCGYNYKGQAYSHILDSFGELCNYRGLKTQAIGTPYSRLVKDKAFNNPCTYNRVALKIKVLYYLKKTLQLKKLSNEWIERQNEKVWIEIITITKPKIIISIQPSIELCRIGKLFHIPVFDYQHGIIAAENPWYGEEFRCNEPKENLPVGYLCWDESSAEVIKTWVDEDIDVKVVGNPWFSRFLFPESHDDLVQSVLERKIFSPGKPVILVSLSWGMDGFYTEDSFNKVMINELENIILRTANQYNWMIRLHPVQLRGHEGKTVDQYLTKTFGHLRESINWDLASELPLPIVLAQTTLHITDFSTVVTEASWFGIPSALLSPELKSDGIYSSYFESERNLGIAKLLPHCTESIFDWIEEHKVCDRKIKTYSDTTVVMKKFITTLMK